MRYTKTMTLTLAASALLLALGCSSQGTSELDWARAALARNPNLEVLSVDEQAGVFTVKDLTTMKIRKLRVDEIAAVPAGGVAAAASSGSSSANNTSATSEAPAESAPVAPGEAASAEPENPAPEVAGTVVSSPEAPTIVTTPATAASGRVVAAGPGYSITRSGGGAAAQNAQAAPPARAAATEPARSEPIICQGQRFMRIDGRSLESSSDAIVAENGCDLHITNANVRANGVALIVRDARVHVTNSTLSGASASIEASGTAEIFVTGSTFDGITRRFDAAVVNDLGGNQFR
jgi:hypothetical protein